MLGPLEIVGDTGPVAVRGAKRRGLLAYLLAQGGRPASLDQIVEAVWAESASPGAAATVRTYVSQLRRLVAAYRGPGCAAELVTTAGGYRLVVPPDGLDVSVFERLTARGPDGETAADRARRLEEALALWRGPPLEEFAGAAWADDATRRWELQHLAASGQYGDALLASGRHDDAVAFLQHLADAHPLHERVWAQLMLALYRCGRNAEALRTGARLRATLADDFGISPTPDIADLERRILNHDPALARDVVTSPGTAVGDRSLAPAERHGAAPARPFPASLSLRHVLPFVGRTAEMDDLERAGEDAVAGTAGAVLLTGEPGAGKTRLAIEVARRAHERGALVLHGRCDEHLAVPFQPFVEAVTWYCEQVPDPELGRHKADLARLADAVGPTDLPPPAPTDPETGRFRLYEAVRSWLVAVGRAQPVVLVLDDLQWATTHTVRMLHHLLARADPVGLLVLVTARDTEPETDASAAFRELVVLPDVRRVAVGPLDKRSVAYLIGPETGVPESGRAAAAAAIMTATAGNAFFVEEYVRAMLAPDGRRHLTEPTQPEGAPTTERLERAVDRRVSRLGEAVGGTLRLAAVIGPEFVVEVLARLLEESPESVVDRLEVAHRARLVDEIDVGVFRFSHALVQSTLLRDRTTTQRVHLHRRIALALDAVSPEATGPIARHWCEAAAVAEPDRIVAAVARAAADALRHGGDDEAEQWYGCGEEALRRVAGIAPDRVTAGLVALHESAGDELSRSGRQRAAHDHLQAAIALAPPSDGVVCARLFRKAGRSLTLAFEFDPAHRLLAAADAALAGSADPTGERTGRWWEQRVQIELDRMELDYWNSDLDAMTAIEHALATDVEEHGTREQRAHFAEVRVMRRILMRQWAVDEETLALADEMVRWSDEANPAHGEHLFLRGLVAVLDRRVEDAEEFLQRSRAVAERTGDGVTAARCWTYLTVASRFRGDVAATRARCDRTAELAEVCGFPQYAACADANRAWTLVREGDHPNARAAAERAIGQWTRPGISHPLQWQAWFPLLVISAAADDRTSTARCARAMLDSNQQPLPPVLAEPLARLAAVHDEHAVRSVVTAATTLGYA